MQRGAFSVLFLFLVALGAAFVWFTSGALPAQVASHFGAHGLPNGFMPREIYAIAMLGICVVLPLLVSLPINLALRRPEAVLNLPNKDYWLAPERRVETVEFVRRQMKGFGIGLLAFICYVHWLVIKANELVPPRLSSVAFVSALVLFAGFVAVWTAIFLNRFRSTR
jgi:hypothetical protein